ncbi:molecular chaperone DnaJ [Cronbergia sp. UHCC 0137]|uniref:molecular chaperone DnaJ n=1 Tax=Cronbergia sp. UHCC 0137 TaxID=3110239 RepID=UPI002B1FF485|nr:molecular chaperone DnaJ [Cronbergia sp. UHCC 0137]MEA5620752.1 molecular chaperone DnaJ [Cronbergia sp. UHCC 0137]
MLTAVAKMTNKPDPNNINPYDILGVSQSASKPEIIKAVNLAMQRGEFPVDVIAKAQKSLMKTEERIIADYLRPILPTIKRFKYTDLSTLAQARPTLELLPEFDGLDQAIIQAKQQEHLEREPLPIPISELYSEGMAACKEGRYPKGIKYLEEYCQNTQVRNNGDYIQAQMWLATAYHKTGQLQRAIALCEVLSNHTHPQINTWANRILAVLYKENSRG